MRHAFTANRRTLAALGLVLGIYLGTLAFTSGPGFWSPDEGIRWMMAQALAAPAEQRLAILYPASLKDPALRFYSSYYHEKVMFPIPLANGTIKYPWASGFARLSGWLQARLGPLGIHLIPVLSAWLSVVFAWLLVKDLLPKGHTWAIFGVALCTPLYFFSQVFWDHTLATSLGLFALYQLSRSPALTWSRVLAAGLALMLASALRVEMIALALALGLAWLLSLWRSRSGSSQLSNEVDMEASLMPRGISSEPNRLPGVRQSIAWLWTGTGLAVLVIFGLLEFRLLLPDRYLLDVTRFFGTFTGQKGFLWALGGLAQRSLVQLPHLLVNSSAAEGLQLPEWLNWAGVIALAGCLIAPFLRSWRREAALLVPAMGLALGLCLAAIFTFQTYRALHGLLITGPYILILAYGLISAWNQRAYPRLMLSLAAASYFVIGSAVVLVFRAGAPGSLWPGLEWGQRFLLTLYPLTVILASVFILDYRRSARPPWLKSTGVALLIALVASAGYVQVRGILMLNQNKQMVTTWTDFLDRQPSEAVVSDVWWLPASLAPYYLGHEVYAVRTEQDLEAWLSQVARQVNSFTYVSYFPLELPSQAGVSPEFKRLEDTIIFGLHFIRYKAVPAPG